MSLFLSHYKKMPVLSRPVVDAVGSVLCHVLTPRVQCYVMLWSVDVLHWSHWDVVSILSSSNSPISSSHLGTLRFQPV